MPQPGHRLRRQPADLVQTPGTTSPLCWQACVPQLPTPPSRCLASFLPLLDKIYEDTQSLGHLCLLPAPNPEPSPISLNVPKSHNTRPSPIVDPS